MTDDVEESLVGSSALPEATRFLNENLRLPFDVPVNYVRCARANAFWNPDNRSIDICHQLGAFLLLHVSQSLAADRDGEPTRHDAFEAEVLATTLDAVQFIYFHEVGHALIDIHKLPITGREEDVADQFATWMLLRDHRPSSERYPSNLTTGEAAALGGASGFLAFAHASFGSSSTRVDWAQTHSFDLERTYNIVCWTYGHDPDGLAWLTDGSPASLHLHVPPHRQPWCAHEYARIHYAFTTLLANHLRR